MSARRGQANPPAKNLSCDAKDHARLRKYLGQNIFSKRGVQVELQQGIESDHFRVKRPMPRVGGFQAFHTARRTIQGFEAMLWLRKGFGFAGAWTVREQNRLLALCFGLPEVNKV